jgi:hypothetical protein
MKPSSDPYTRMMWVVIVVYAIALFLVLGVVLPA